MKVRSNKIPWNLISRPQMWRTSISRKSIECSMMKSERTEAEIVGITLSRSHCGHLPSLLKTKTKTNNRLLGQLGVKYHSQHFWGPWNNITGNHKLNIFISLCCLDLNLDFWKQKTRTNLIAQYTSLKPSSSIFSNTQWKDLKLNSGFFFLRS